MSIKLKSEVFDRTWEFDASVVEEASERIAELEEMEDIGVYAIYEKSEIDAKLEALDQLEADFEL